MLTLGQRTDSGGQTETCSNFIASLEQDAEQVVGVVPHQVVGAVEFADVPVGVVLDSLV
jgi:hypothetical protein